MFNSKRYCNLLAAVVIWAGCAATSVLAFDETCRSQSTTRFALVIGNEYAGARTVAGRLDAEIIARHLCYLGFSVDLVQNATLERLKGNPAGNEKGVVKEFAERIANAKEVVFFYSGHGYQIGDLNYLLPNDQEIDFAEPQFPLSEIFRALNAAPNRAVKVVFLDACRTLANPPSGLRKNGLAKPQAIPPTTLLSFAAEFDSAVPSGKGGELSPYSRALARSIREPGLKIASLLARVSSEVASTQTPIYQGNNFPEYRFREAVKLPIKVKSANDQLVIFHNGKLALATSAEDENGQRETTLELSAGVNQLSLLLFNAKTFRSSQSWQPTEGWEYELEVGWPDKEAIKCQNAPACFKASETTPFKSGPHHGKVFEVARAEIIVDPGTAAVEATIDSDVWKSQVPLWTLEQELLWQSPLSALGLEERPSIKQLVEVYLLVKGLVSALQITKTVDLPDLGDLFAQVYGHEGLHKAVDFCMGEERSRRLDELEISLKHFLEGSMPRPFENFDSGLSTCVQEWIQRHPTHSLFGQEPRIWTALEEKPDGGQS